MSQPRIRSNNGASRGSARACNRRSMMLSPVSAMRSVEVIGDSPSFPSGPGIERGAIAAEALYDRADRPAAHEVPRAEHEIQRIGRVDRIVGDGDSAEELHHPDRVDE